jgi:Spx/MgsR family transcriptional regulator
MNITIYGIKSCETMNKARAWLDGHGVDYAFHDYKTAGIDRERLQRWSKKVGWETLLNRAGMTFRKLPVKDKAGINDSGKSPTSFHHHCAKFFGKRAASPKPIG